MPSRSLRDLIAGSFVGLSLCVSAMADDAHPSSAPPGPAGAQPPAASDIVGAPPAGTEIIMLEPSAVFADNSYRRCGGLYVLGEAVFLDRNTPDLLISQTSGTGGRAPGFAAISGEDLNFDMEAGTRLTVGYQYDANSAIEGTFTGFLDWNSKAAAAGPGDLDAGFLSIFPAFSGIFGSAVHSASYSSHLNMVELNHISRVGQRGTFLVGARFIDLEEDYQLVAINPNVAPPQIGQYDVKTRNYMVGPQVGGTYEWTLRRRLSLDASAKLGVMGNFFDVGTNVVNSGFPLAINDQEQEVALGAVTDLGLNLRYRLSNSLTVHGGYQVLAIYGAALAIDQHWDSTDTGDIVYHGPNVGLEWRR